MRKVFVDELATRGLISEKQYSEILEWFSKKPFSLHWELRTLLYAGVLLLASGLGIIIYDNIESIGHTVIILLIAVACAGCFYYCFRNRKPWTHERVIYETPWFDYVLLLGCMLFLALEGYLQFQYKIFGTHYGLASLVPAMLFFFLAFYFDHLGVLSMAITALASFAGFTVSPSFLLGSGFLENALVFTGLSLAVFLIGAGYILKDKNIKKHFTFTWYNFGFNIIFICLLAALFTFDYPVIYFCLHIAGVVILMRYALAEKSFYFLLLSVIYGYIAITWAVFQLNLEETIGLYYFVFSCIGVIWFFLNYKKILKLK